MTGLKIEIIVSVVFLVLGYLIYKKQKINLIHSYHYKNVKDEDKKAYTKEFCKGMNTIAMVLLITSILNYVTNNEWFWIIFCLTFAYSFMIFRKAQMKYNSGK
ncbi:MAG: DUF3784 domain-containing protein [Clostridia bacterium]